MKTWKVISLLFAAVFFYMDTHAADHLYRADIDNTQVGVPLAVNSKFQGMIKALSDF